MVKVKFLEPSERIYKLYLTDVKGRSVPKLRKEWEKEFKKFISGLLTLVYGDDSKVIKQCLEEPFLSHLWERAFIDETVHAEKNYELLEFYGDTVFGYAVGRYLYIHYSSDLDMASSATFTNISNYVEGGEYMEEMAINLNMIKWVNIRNTEINITRKVRSNLIESFFGALDFVTRGVKNKYYKETGCDFIFGPEAGYRFLENYFKIFPLDLEKSQIGRSKGFFTDRLPGTFGIKGSIGFIKINNNPEYKFFINEDAIRLLSENIGKDKEPILRSLNTNKKYISNDQNKLAYTIYKEVFEAQLGINENWLEEYKVGNNLETIPEPYKTKLITKVIGGDKYVTIKFSVPNLYNTPDQRTVVMYRITGNDKGRTIKREVLDTYTGKHSSTSFPYHLRNELVKRYVENN